MGPVPAVACFRERVGREHRRALGGDGRLDGGRRVRIVDIAVVDDLIRAVTEEPKALEALGTGHGASIR